MNKLTYKNVNVNVDKLISLSECILNYGTMKADCKYCKNSKCCAHNAPKEHVCVPGLHWVVQSWTPNLHGVTELGQRATRTTTFELGPQHFHSAWRSSALKEKCSIMSVAKTQTVACFPCFGFHTCCA